MIYHNVIFFKNMERCPVCKNKTISLSMRLKSINGKIKCPYCKNNLNIKMNFLGMITQDIHNLPFRKQIRISAIVRVGYCYITIVNALVRAIGDLFTSRRKIWLSNAPIINYQAAYITAHITTNAITAALNYQAAYITAHRTLSGR